jgi:hypothetical protein
LLPERDITALSLEPEDHIDIELADGSIQQAIEFGQVRVELTYDDRITTHADVRVLYIPSSGSPCMDVGAESASSEEPQQVAPEATPLKVSGEKRTRCDSDDSRCSIKTLTRKSPGAQPPRLLGYAALHLLGVEQDYKNHRLQRITRMRV